MMRRNVNNTNVDDTNADHPTACMVHVPDSPYGGIDLPPDEVYQVHTPSSRHPPFPRPRNPSRPSFRPQSQKSGPNNPIRRYVWSHLPAFSNLKVIESGCNEGL